MPISPNPPAARKKKEFFLPECVRLDEKGVLWGGEVTKGEGTRWHKMPDKGTVVHPPPPDLSCQACGRGPDELRRFGGPGDPLAHDYSGAILVKRSREEGLFGERWECRECILLTDEEIRAASLQFVRKLSGFNHPSKANQLAFDRACPGGRGSSVDRTACPPRMER